MEGDGWGWGYNLFLWENELMVECVSLFANVNLQDHVKDLWLWKILTIGVYSLKDICLGLIHNSNIDRSPFGDII